MPQNYTPEFKKKIVRLHEEEGRTYKSITAEYGVSKASISKWCSQLREECQTSPETKEEYDYMKERLSAYRESVRNLVSLEVHASLDKSSICRNLLSILGNFLLSNLPSTFSITRILLSIHLEQIFCMETRHLQICHFSWALPTPLPLE